jgi:hypothetical protein
MNVDVYEEHVRYVKIPWTGIFTAYVGQMWCVFDCAIGMLWRGGHCKRCVDGVTDVVRKKIVRHMLFC